MDGRRWSSYQPNVPGRGIVAGYTARFWAIVVVLGVITGVLASALVELLRLVEHVAYGYRRGPFLDGVQASVGWRHFVALKTAAVIVIVSGLVLGRPRGSEATEVSESLWLSEGRLPLLSSLARGVVAIVTVGLGSSMGRESRAAGRLGGRLVVVGVRAVARLAAATVGGVRSGRGVRGDLRRAPRRCTVRARGAARHGRAPVRVAGARHSVIATAVAWITLGTKPTYDLPHYLLHPDSSSCSDCWRARSSGSPRSAGCGR